MMSNLIIDDDPHLQLNFYYIACSAMGSVVLGIIKVMKNCSLAGGNLENSQKDFLNSILLGLG